DLFHTFIDEFIIWIGKADRLCIHTHFVEIVVDLQLFFGDGCLVFFYRMVFILSHRSTTNYASLSAAFLTLTIDVKTIFLIPNEYIFFHKILKAFLYFLIVGFCLQLFVLFLCMFWVDNMQKAVGIFIQFSTEVFFSIADVRSTCHQMYFVS